MRISRKKATIYDLSQMSGRSPSTVSAVINGTWRQRRISEETAAAILKLAGEQSYLANRQAQGLRNSRSGLVGLLLPLYDNRFFSSMAQAFEAIVRSRGLCPVVVSAGRDPEEERATVETLISYSIESLVICGATDPDSLHDLCEKAGIPHVNVDLPGSKAPSVTSDNFAGGDELTEAIILEAAKLQAAPITGRDVWLIGGRDDHATRERIRGFHHAKQRLLADDPEGCVLTTGYSATNAKLAIQGILERDGRLPRALFVNSTINLEGLLRFVVERPLEDYSGIVVGSFDYDPFASFMRFPVIMVRQDVEGMLAKAFELLDHPPTRPVIHHVMPVVIPPQSALAGPLDALKNIA